MTIREAVEFVKLLRIDVFMLFFVFAISLPGVTINQLVEDKVCINDLHLGPKVCLDLEKLADDGDSGWQKNFVLRTAAHFKNYQTLIATAPGIVLSLFMGYWVDSYPQHLKYIIAAPCLGGIASALIFIHNCIYFDNDYIYILYASVPTGLCGGLAAVFTGTYTYVARKTPSHYRAVRFAVLEFFIGSTSPLSIYLGGTILSTKAWINNQPRNYILVFTLSGISYLIAFIWILIFLYDADREDWSSRRRRKYSSLNSEGVEPSPKPDEPINQDTSGNASISTEVSTTFGSRFFETFWDIFNIDNVAHMVHTCCKTRPNNGRVRLWHLMLSMVFTFLCWLGDDAINYQFSQKVYQWDAKLFSDVNSAINLISSLTTTIIAPVLIHWLHFPDTTIAVLGCLSLLSSTIIKGGVLTPYGYFLSFLFGLICGLLTISIRSIISKIVHPDEIGQVFALLSSIQACAPFLSSLFYSSIFGATIDVYPGIVYQIASIFLFYPFLVTIWLDITRHRWYPKNRPLLEIDSKDTNPSTFEDSQASSSNNPVGPAVKIFSVNNDQEQLVETSD